MANTKDTSPRYDRTLSPCFERLLQKGGALEFLIKDYVTDGINGDPYALDIHFRENDELMFYHGTTRLLVVSWKMTDDGKESIKFSAHQAYHKNGNAKRLRIMNEDLSLEEASAMRETCQSYLETAANSSNARYYKNKKEGYWQNKLCRNFGSFWKGEKDWLTIDRECVIGFDSKNKKDEFYRSIKGKYQDLKWRLQKSEDAFGKCKCQGFGDELDMLAIGQNKELLCIELKYGSGRNVEGIYWGPLQVGVYRDAFNKVIPQISKDLKSLVKQKAKLGLLPLDAPQMLPEDGENFHVVSAVLAVAEPPKPKSQCWKKMQNVIHEMQENALSCDIEFVGITGKDREIAFGPTLNIARCL